jgi:heme-degrading monooxygenase HmoA
MHAQTNTSKNSIKMETLQTTKTDTTQRILIDKLIVPPEAKQDFLERLNFNRNFIRQLPGFIEDVVYQSIDEQDNLVYVTVATWQNEDAIKNAKAAVQAEYKRQHFDLQEMLKRLHIIIDRGIYKKGAN